MSGNGINTNWENDGGVTLGAVLASQAMHEFTEKLKIITPSINSPNASTTQVIIEGMSEDPKAFLDAVGVYIRAFGNAVDVVGDGLAEKDAREDPYDRFARAKGELKEGAVEVWGSVVKTGADVVGFVTSHTGEVIGLWQELEHHKQTGDHDAAARVTGEIMSAIVGMGMMVIKSGFSGALLISHEVGEGYGEFNDALTDAIVNGETDLTPVSVDPGSAGMNNTYTGGGSGTTGSADATHSSDVDTGGHESYQNDDPGAPEERKSSDNHETAETQEEGSGDEPSDDPADGGGKPTDESGGDEGEDEPGGATVFVPKEQDDDSEEDSEHNFDDGREKESDDDVEETDEADDGSSSDTSDDDGEDDQGYTPGFDDGTGGGTLTAGLIASVLSSVSDGLKTYEPGYIPPMMGAAAQAFGDAVDQILFDLVSRPNGVDDDPIIPKDADLGELFDTSDIWLPMGGPDLKTDESSVFDQSIDLF